MPLRILIQSSFLLLKEISECCGACEIRKAVWSQAHTFGNVSATSNCVLFWIVSYFDFQALIRPHVFSVNSKKIAVNARQMKLSDAAQSKSFSLNHNNNNKTSRIPKCVWNYWKECVLNNVDKKQYHSHSIILLHMC